MVTHRNRRTLIQNVETVQIHINVWAQVRSNVNAYDVAFVAAVSVFAAVGLALAFPFFDFPPATARDAAGATSSSGRTSVVVMGCKPVKPASLRQLNVNNII